SRLAYCVLPCYDRDLQKVGSNSYLPRRHMHPCKLDHPASVRSVELPPVSCPRPLSRRSLDAGRRQSHNHVKKLWVIVDAASRFSGATWPCSTPGMELLVILKPRRAP